MALTEQEWDDAGHADGGADGAAFHQRRNHRNPLGRAQLVHNDYYAYSNGAPVNS